jgi:tetratricopeptide (TPR) repeat protein
VLEVQGAAGNPIDIAQTTSALGRLAARAGRFDDAQELLAQARALFEQEGDELELLTTDSRLGESLVLQGEGAAALELSTSALERSESLEGVSLQVAMLRRLRGWAFMQAGALARAREELQESLRVARLGDANFGAESADYDAALTLDALVRLGQLTGESTKESERERDVILERLGVVSWPQPPLLLLEGSVP